MSIIPDSVLTAYVTAAVRMHGSAGKDIGDKIDHPDEGEQIGEYPGGQIWRVADGWGEYYFVDPKRGEAKFVACKMPDVMAVDVAAEFSDKIRHKDIGMGDVAWDRAVVDALEGKMTATEEKKVEWSKSLVDALPDSSFAYVEPGGTKDASGRTSPLSLRCLPYKTASGEVDRAQLALAIEAAQKTGLPRSTQARVVAKLEAVEKSLGVEKVWSDEARAAALEARRRGYAGRSGMLKHPSGDELEIDEDGAWAHASGKDLDATDDRNDVPRTINTGSKSLLQHLDSVHGPKKSEANKHPKEKSEEIEKEWSDAARAASAEARRHGYRPGGQGELTHPKGYHVAINSNGSWEHGSTEGDWSDEDREKYPDRYATGLGSKELKRHLSDIHGSPKKSEGIEKYITHSGDKWTVHAESGKVLGTHDSEADARAQLAAVEANKHPKEKSEEIEKEWSDAAREAAAEARKRGWQKSHDQNTIHENGSKSKIRVFMHPNLPGHKLSIDHDPVGPTADRSISKPEGVWNHMDPKGAQRTNSGAASLKDYLNKLHGARKDVHWPVDDSRFRGSSLTDAGERAPNQPRKSEGILSEVREAVKAAAGPGSRVQELVFDKGKYKEAADAKGWASDHGFESGKVDETGESFRIRQEDPGKFARMRTIGLTEGVKAVVGFPKKSIDAVKDAFFTTASGRLAFKAEDLAAAEFEAVEENSSGTVYRVKVGDVVTHFAESGGIAAPIPMYHELRKSRYVPISKSEGDEKRYTLGVVYPASKKGTPEPDFHGDVMSEAEIEKSAWGFMSKGNDRVGLMHRPGTTGAGRVVESYVYRGPSYKTKDATGAEQEISPGDWMLGVVWEPEAWKAIKGGTITGYSLQGAARKESF